jgi:hypothetical protein
LVGLHPGGKGGIQRGLGAFGRGRREKPMEKGRSENFEKKPIVREDEGKAIRRGGKEKP